MKVSKAQAQGAASGGKVTVRRQGKATNEVASVDRQIGSVVAAGDWLLVLEADRNLWGFMLLGTAPGSLSDAPTPPEQSPEQGGTIKGTDTVPPTWSGTYRSGSWRSDTSHMVQGPSSWGMSRGAAFYGRKLQSLPGSIVDLDVRVERMSYGSYSSQSPTMALLRGRSKPSGFPTVLRTATGPSLGAPGSVKWWGVPSSWLGDINDGTAGGIGVVGTGNYMRFNGPGMRVRARWQD